MVDVGLISGIRDFVHLSLHFFELSGLNKGTAYCPDCVCGSCVLVVQEKVPEAVTSALAFAQSHCLSTTSSTTIASPSSGWSFNLFWLGCLVGFLVTSGLWILLLCALRCLRPVTSARASVPTAVPTLALQNQLESEPVNPTKLRELGLIR